MTEDKIQEAKVFYQMHFKQAVFDEEGWRKVLEVFRDGFNYTCVPITLLCERRSKKKLFFFSVSETQWSPSYSHQSGSRREDHTKRQRSVYCGKYRSGFLLAHQLH